MDTSRSDNTLRNRTVIITAGNRGGGAAVALRFASAGASVVIIAPKAPDSQMTELSARINSAGGRLLPLEVNLADADEIYNAVAQAKSHFGGIDILINNFSTFNFKSTLETKPEEFGKVMGNIYTTFFFSQACIPYLKESQNPHVINIAPPLDMKSAQDACERHLLFSLSKYGMSFCTMGMAREFREFGIAFNCLWQERPISTATLKNNFANGVVRGSNRPEIYAEAAYLISLKSARDFTGNYCIDESILLENGIDLTKYAVDPSAPAVKDIFLPGADYNVLKSLFIK